jgi:hypothetical protein
VKRGHFILYAGTANREIKVYEIDLYGNHNATKLLTKIANIHSMLETSLYTSNSFYLESYRNHDGQLLNEILKEQLDNLQDCVAILHDNFIGYYKNGFLIATDSLSKYQQPVSREGLHFVDGKKNLIPLVPLINSPFDSLVLKTL